MFYEKTHFLIFHILSSCSFWINCNLGFGKYEREKKSWKMLKLVLVVKKQSHLLTTCQVPHLWLDEINTFAEVKMMNSSTES